MSSSKKTKRKNRKSTVKDIIRKIIVVLIFIAGLGIFLYPTFSDIYGKYRDSKLMTKYTNSVNKISNDDIEEDLRKAREYNEKLRLNSSQIVTEGLYASNFKKKGTPEEKEYESLLNASKNGVMGYMDIPGIAVSLPFYHYGNEEVVDKGVGHIYGSSLPVGGEGTHAILIGHRGLPTSKLFSDLDKVKVGDKFYIHVYNEVLAYQVINVEVVLPTEVEKLKIEDGRDLVTLVTCTPYGVNSHRILVTGERVPYNGENTSPKVIDVIKTTVDPETILGLTLVLVIVFLLLSKRRKRYEDEKEPYTPVEAKVINEDDPEYKDLQSIADIPKDTEIKDK